MRERRNALEQTVFPPLRLRCPLRRRLAVPAAVLAVLLAGCAAPDGSLARMERAGVLRVGYAPERPYAFRTPDGGIAGHDPELLESVARSLAVGRVEWVQAEFGTLLDDLETGRYDVVGMSLAITPERAARAAFSVPTSMAANALLVAAGNPRRLFGYGDVARTPGVRLAVIAGAVEEGFARRAGVPRSRLVEVPDAMTGLAAVRTGFAAAFGLTAPTLRFLTRGENGAAFDVVAPVQDSDPAVVPARTVGAFVFRTEDVSLRRAFDAALEARLHTPEYRAIARRYGFGVQWLEAPEAGGNTRSGAGGGEQR